MQDAVAHFPEGTNVDQEVGATSWKPALRLGSRRYRFMRGGSETPVPDGYRTR